MKRVNDVYEINVLYMERIHLSLGYNGLDSSAQYSKTFDWTRGT